MVQNNDFERKLAVEEAQVRAARTGLNLQGISISVSVLAAIFAFLANQSSQTVQANFGNLQHELQTDQARGQLLTTGVTYMEKMVDPDLNGEKRLQACFTSLEMALIEKGLGSQHILNLHQKFLKMKPVPAGEVVPDLCENQSGEAVFAPLGKGSFDLKAEPTEILVGNLETLASSLVVLASYREQNCSIAFTAKKALSKAFPEEAEQSAIVVAKSRSHHFTVVYNPNKNGETATLFLAKARAAGLAAFERVKSPEDNSALDAQNLQYVKDAYIAGSKGWELRADCD